MLRSTFVLILFTLQLSTCAATTPKLEGDHLIDWLRRHSTADGVRILTEASGDDEDFGGSGYPPFDLHAVENQTDLPPASRTRFPKSESATDADDQPHSIYNTDIDDVHDGGSRLNCFSLRPKSLVMCRTAWALLVAIVLLLLLALLATFTVGFAYHLRHRIRRPREHTATLKLVLDVA